MNPPVSLESRLRTYLLNPWRELALFSLMVMEISWITALYTAVLDRARPDSLPRAMLVFGPIYLGVHILVRVMNHYSIRVKIRRVVLAVLLAVSLQAALLVLVPRGTNPSILAFIREPLLHIEGDVIIPIHFWIMLSVSLLWLRSISLARYPVGTDLTVNSFKFGMVMWLFYGILSLVVDQTRAPWVLFLFMFAGLVSMSASRLTEITGMRGGRQVRFHRAWLAGIAGSTLLVLGTGFFVASLLQGELAALTQAIVMILAGIVLLALMLLVAPLVVLFLVIIPKIDELFSGVNVLPKIRNISEQLLQVFQPLFDNEKLQTFFGRLWAARGLVMLAVIVIVGIIILFSSRWLQHRSREASEDEPEPILSGRELLRQLRDSLRQRLQRLVDRLRGRSGLRDARRLLAAMRIRWIYSQLIELASRLDHPRPQAVTPLEFQPVLQGLFPALASQVSLITSAYIQVRYGEIPERDEEIQAVAEAWKQIEASAQPQLADKNPKRKLNRY